MRRQHVSKTELRLDLAGVVLRDCATSTLPLLTPAEKSHYAEAASEQWKSGRKWSGRNRRVCRQSISDLGLAI